MIEKRSYFKHNTKRLYQGDIFSHITLIQSVTKQETEIVTEERLLPYAVVISQECDLEQDVNSRTDSDTHDKYLPSILLSPAYPAEMLKLGNHLDQYNQKMQIFSTDRFKQLKQNNNTRYHFLHADNEFHVPELVIDFKHIFSVARDIAYASFLEGYIATVAPLFRENLSLRLFNYLSRIGLPETIAE